MSGPTITNSLGNSLTNAVKGAAELAKSLPPPIKGAASATSDFASKLLSGASEVSSFKSVLYLHLLVFLAPFRVALREELTPA